MLRPLLVASALLLAGCAASEEPRAADAPVPSNATFVEDYDLGNVTVAKEELQNATLGEEHRHDAWGASVELVLLEGTVEAGLCEGPVDALFYLGQEALETQGANYGCARIFLPEGTVVPEGTGILRFEVDATQALKAGGYTLQWRNKAHEVEEPPTTEPVHAWDVALDSSDWDIAHAKATSFVMYLVSHEAPAGAFEGPVGVRVVAKRLDGWEPILAIAHVDHWKLASLHDLVAPGVMRILDGEGNVTNVDPQRLFGAGLPEPVPFDDIIAPGARYLVVVADTTASTCPAVMQCWYVPELIVGGYERTRFGTLLFEEGARRAYVWTVPDEVPEDSVYANASTTSITGRIDACAAGDSGGPSCGFVSVASDSVSARLQAFTWQGEVDLALLRALVEGA